MAVCICICTVADGNDGDGDDSGDKVFFSERIGWAYTEVYNVNATNCFRAYLVTTSAVTTSNDRGPQMNKNLSATKCQLNRNVRK